MKLVFNTIAALALTATTAFAAGVEGPAMSPDDAVPGTTGQIVTIAAPKFISKRHAQEATNGMLQVTFYEGSEAISTAPGGAHFR